MTQRIRAVSAVIALLCASDASAQWTTSQLQVPRYGHAAAATDTAAYFAGGYRQFGLLGSVDVVDRQGVVQPPLQLSVARARLAAASDGDRVYFAGGIVASTQCVTDLVEIYDESTGTWQITHMPIPVSHVAGIALPGMVVFAGGTSGCITNAQAVAQVYDVASGTWSVVDLRTPGRAIIAAAADDRWICLAGGGGVPPANRVLNVYDSLTDSWSAHIIPQLHEGQGIAIMDGKLYLYAIDRLAIFDLAERTWDFADLPTYRPFAFGASVGPYVVFANGATGQFGVSHDTADVLNVHTGIWRTVSLGVAARDRAAVTCGESIFIAGGTEGNGGAFIASTIDIMTVDLALGRPYCGPAVSNSQGHPANIRAHGSSAVLENYLTLVLEGAPIGSAGMFLVSAAAAGGVVPPGAQGPICLGNPLGRIGASVGAVGVDGILAHEVDLLGLPFVPNIAVAPGETWHFQAWYRDSNPGPTTNLSDAIAVLFR